LFNIDGVTKQTWPCATYPYAFYSFAVSSGTHTFNWVHGSFGGQFWVDDVTITNAGAGTTALFNGGNVGIGFAMPINRAKLMLDDFQAGRKRPRLGVSVVPVAGDYADALNLPNQGGLLIQEVEQGSPAARAGLKGGREVVQIGNAQLMMGGDLIMSIDGKPIDRDDAISRTLARKRAGDFVELTIYRSGRTMNVKVKLGEEGAI